MSKEYIERGAFIESIKRLYCEPCKADGKDYRECMCRACWVDDMRCEVDDFPTADVVEVKHGRWKLNKDGSGTCNQCHRTQGEVWDMDTWQNFCGHCGAIMDGGAEDGE